MAEIHTIGSPPLLEAVVRVACSGGARPAEPGEFTLRAFLAGRVDLTQAEAVLGVIDAAGRAELDAALAQLAGGLADPLRGLRGDLIELLAHLEAGLDFADEDLSFITPSELLGRLNAVSEQLDRIAQKLAFRGETAARVRVVLCGRPNAGKSSLFNALAGHPSAIVSHQPGTTRDYLAAELDLDGVKCLLIDTAGMEDPIRVQPGSPEDGEASDSDVQGAAKGMTREQVRTAHVLLICDEDADVLRDEAEISFQHPAAARILVLTKCDQRSGRQPLPPGALATSAATGLGVRRLAEAIRGEVLRASAPATDAVAGTAIRCGESLRLAAASLGRARHAVADALGEEIVAAEVRVALNEIGKVIGTVYTEEVLDRIFSRFCIGK